LASDADLRLLRVEEGARRLGRLLRECGKISGYAADKDLQSIAERNIQIVVEGLVDLGNVLLSRNRWPTPRSAAETVRTLVAQGALQASWLLHVLSATTPSISPRRRYRQVLE